MKVLGLDGKLYPWNPTSNLSGEKSMYHTKAKTLIKTLYSTETLLEEVSLSGTKPTLFADFVLPRRKIIVEVHGEQHYKHILHFHPTKRDFVNAQQRDYKKTEWCKLNGFSYVELPCSEGIDEWRSRILGISPE